jgi:hypothetical protein
VPQLLVGQPGEQQLDADQAGDRADVDDDRVEAAGLGAG